MKKRHTKKILKKFMSEYEQGMRDFVEWFNKHDNCANRKPTEGLCPPVAT
jgi:hypothetical protein